MAVPTSGQRQTVPDLQEGHQTSHGLPNHEGQTQGQCVSRDNKNVTRRPFSRRPTQRLPTGARVSLCGGGGGVPFSREGGLRSPSEQVGTGSKRWGPGLGRGSPHVVAVEGKGLGGGGTTYFRENADENVCLVFGEDF